MAPRYNLASDVEGGDGLQSTSPHWVLGFARWANPATYDPTAGDEVHKTLSVKSIDAYEERPVLVVMDECVSLRVSDSKSNHTMEMSAELLDKGTSLMNEILPGDWVVANILYSREECLRVAAAMGKQEPINGWNDGLKFVGRVSSFRKQVTIDGATGTPRSVYNLICVGFAELDTTVMYYPQLANQSALPTSLLEFGVLVNQIVRGEQSREMGGIDINKIWPAIIQAIYGSGSWANAPQQKAATAQTPSAATKKRNADVSSPPAVTSVGPVSPNSRYIVPFTVMSWLGLEGSGTFADIMRLMVGVQKYSNVASANEKTANPWALFQPDGVHFENGAYKTSHDLVGTFPLSAIPQGQTTAWAVLANFMNAPLNETVVSLRPDLNGRTLPTLVIRQTPFTSNDQAYLIEQRAINEEAEMAEPPPPTDKPTFMLDNLQKATAFLELPRWVVSTGMLTSADIGRSDQQRHNVCFVAGTGPGNLPTTVEQFIRAKPIQDDMDIARNGVRPYMPSVNCFLKDYVLGPTQWRDLMADIVMGEHLKLNGTMTISGVRAPVASGDNLEFEGTVYHIENLTHICRLNPATGIRQFMTSVGVSHGTFEDQEILADRSTQFPNTKSDDLEYPWVSTTSDGQE
jgi:hypothetical protein